MRMLARVIRRSSELLLLESWIGGLGFDAAEWACYAGMEVYDGVHEAVDRSCVMPAKTQRVTILFAFLALLYNDALVGA